MTWLRILAVLVVLWIVSALFYDWISIRRARKRLRRAKLAERFRL